MRLCFLLLSFQPLVHSSLEGYGLRSMVKTPTLTLLFLPILPGSSHISPTLVIPKSYLDFSRQLQMPPFWCPYISNLWRSKLSIYLHVFPKSKLLFCFLFQLMSPPFPWSYGPEIWRSHWFRCTFVKYWRLYLPWIIYEKYQISVYYPEPSKNMPRLQWILTICWMISWEAPLRIL